MNSDDLHVNREYTDGHTTRKLLSVGLRGGEYTANFTPALDQATPPFKRWGGRQTCLLENFAKWAVRETNR